ncbi:MULTISPECIES: L-dopachrome tautomerase-related protein [unclassified Sphingobacterium]|uniref:L-dopachrome tautomerase-related protein n=1 Tax=unclassified Sphingobacterium TaxID=2609468 RepID=UPI001051E543|nr:MULTISPECIES: L-dopachrome tautomerase-related protein [unclassified Sphingobacterium]MBB2949588.1 quercetin dioxygenase-like cupin family protein [Sphingobacterium sp. JUb56]MCS3554308.1 quercetin dioxygenase-like cupin family protein [Sphingobacterium sp. JUb21]TCR08141.1 cupin domain [Sphingobacterium sp. JUb20]
MFLLKKSIVFVLFTFAVMNFAVAQLPKEIQHIKFDDLGWEKLADRLYRKYVFGEQGMLALFKMDKGAKVPLHQHSNEQTTYITKGSVKVTMQNKDYIVKAGEVLIIPGNIPHEFECLEDGTLDIDFFAPPRKDWIDGTASYFGNDQENKRDLEAVAQLDVRPGDVAVSAEGRIFSTIHPLGSQQLQLVEIVDGKAVPYPNLKMQKNGAKASDTTFDAMLGLIFDKQNRLWVVDMGLELGKTRLWAFDIQQNKVIEKITLPSRIAPKGTFAQDVTIDEKHGFAYLADIADPGIIVLNLKTKKATRFGKHFSFDAEDKDMVIDGKVVHFGGKPARVGIDPITLSDDRETLFYGAMNGTGWYSIPTKVLRGHQPGQLVFDQIIKVGDKPFSDGALTDWEGNHYFTNLQEHAITKMDKKGKLSHIIQDDDKLLWPDNVYQGPDDWMYISINQLNTAPAFTGGKDIGVAPYFIYRFKKK